MQVTARNISSLPPGTHRAERCLYLRKRDGHAPTWIFRYTISGKQKDVVIGTSDAVSIAQAKETAVRFRTMIADGVDPLAAKQERREKMRNAGANVDHPFTFADLVAEALPVIIRSKAWRNQKHAAQWKSTLEQYAMPSLGSLFVDDVTRDDILSVLEPIWKTKPETASRLRGRLEAVFAYAIAIGKRAGGNPATWRGNLEMFLPPITKMKKEKHHDALTLDQARLLFDGWRPPTSITACAILFGALTASRVGEFVPAKWDEIDLRRKVWLCPPRAAQGRKELPAPRPTVQAARRYAEDAPAQFTIRICRTRRVSHLERDATRSDSEEDRTWHNARLPIYIPRLVRRKREGSDRRRKKSDARNW